MFYQSDTYTNSQRGNKLTRCNIAGYSNSVLNIKDENVHPNQQLTTMKMKENETRISSEYESNSTSLKDPNKMSKETDELYISIRRVGMEDHLSIVKLFQVIKCYKVYRGYLDKMVNIMQIFFNVKL